jgi:predicted nucleic acid-binding protein
MKTYHDRPMDSADATLVHLAQRESVVTVVTIDYDDVETCVLADAGGPVSCRPGEGSS